MKFTVNQLSSAIGALEQSPYKELAKKLAQFSSDWYRGSRSIKLTGEEEFLARVALAIPTARDYELLMLPLDAPRQHLFGQTYHALVWSSRDEMLKTLRHEKSYLIRYEEEKLKEDQAIIEETAKRMQNRETRIKKLKWEQEKIK